MSEVIKFLVVMLIIMMPFLITYIKVKKKPLIIPCIACDTGSWWYKCKKGTGATAKLDKNGKKIIEKDGEIKLSKTSKSCGKFLKSVKMIKDAGRTVSNIVSQVKIIPQGITSAVKTVKAELGKISIPEIDLGLDNLSIPKVNISCPISSPPEIDSLCTNEITKFVCGGKDKLFDINPCTPIETGINAGITGMETGLKLTGTAITSAFDAIGNTIDENVVKPVESQMKQLVKPITDIKNTAVKLGKESFDLILEIVKNIVQLITFTFMNVINRILPFSPPINIALIIITIFLAYFGGIINFLIPFIGAMIKFFMKILSIIIKSISTTIKLTGSAIKLKNKLSKQLKAKVDEFKSSKN